MKTPTLIALLLVAAGAADAAVCKHERALDFEADATALRALEITTGAGGLVVRGTPGSDRIVATATACASSTRLLEGLALDHRRSGDRLVVETRHPEEGWSGFGRRYAYIDLELSVPDALEVEVEDGSGAVEIERVAAVSIVDASGDLALRDIAGAVRIEDGSGAIRVRTVAGAVRIEDGSGGIDVAGVEGDVVVSEDGSGEIEVRDVVGSVEIEEDGSGEIRIAGVGGSVLIGRDGSGAIDVAGVAGDFEVGRDGGGGVTYRDVRGEVALPQDRERVH